MSYCLYCHIKMEQKVSWGQFLGIDTKNFICNSCEIKLDKIGKEICDCCGRSLLDLDPKFRNENVCIDCERWESNEEWRGTFTRNRSIYHYNDALKEFIYTFKYRGDAELSKIFGTQMKKILEQYFTDHIIVPIPLSKQRMYERGFNQAELLAKHIGEPIPALRRTTHEEKQSKKGREERLKPQDHPIFVIENSLKKYIENYDIILIDDIYTTGSTIRQAAKALKLAGAKSISSITIAR